MQVRTTPEGWRMGFSLCRRQQVLDSLGETKIVYDLENPDVVVQDGAQEAICWQVVRSWQSSGRLSSGQQQLEHGEQAVETLQGVCRSDLETEPGDRFIIHDAIYELKQVQMWPCHRLFLLERVR